MSRDLGNVRAAKPVREMGLTAQSLEFVQNPILLATAYLEGKISGRTQWPLILCVKH